MTEIIPAILPKNYEDLKNHITQIRGISTLVQIDICDGVFVKSITWPFLSRAEDNFLDSHFDQHFLRILNEEEGLPLWEEVDFELDLMVASAIENFHTYLKLGPKRVVFHIDAPDIKENLEEFKNFLEGLDVYIRDTVSIGVAVNPDSSLEDLYPLVNNLDFIQCMGIDKTGYQGQEFDEKCLTNIKSLKEKFPDLIISVDGGVNFDTAPLLVQAGADRLVIGSAIFNSDDIIETIEAFKAC